MTPMNGQPKLAVVDEPTRAPDGDDERANLFEAAIMACEGLIARIQAQDPMDDTLSEIACAVKGLRELLVKISMG